MTLAITSTGMVGSVGLTARGACAALRAGLRRPTQLSYFDGVDEELETSGVLGHPVRGFSDGYYLVGRWLRLAHGTLRDLLDGRNASEVLSEAAVLAVLPTMDERFEVPAPPPAGYFEEHFIDVLWSQLGVAQLEDSSRQVFFGAEGLVAALRAAEGLRQKTLILAVDSCVEPSSLKWLMNHGRIKLPDSSVGCEPGEACVALLVEPRDDAGVVVRALASERQGTCFFDQDSPSTGAGLSVAMRQALTTSGFELPFCGPLVTNLNGEQWLSEEHSLGLLRNRPALVHEEAPWLIPAMSFGEVGSAATAVGVCVAAEYLARGYTDSPDALVLNLSEFGMASAIALSATKE